MVGLSERKVEILRALVEASPDKVVGALQASLAGTSGDDTALAGVRRLVEAEAHDRRLRNIALQPIAPLCVGDGRASDRLTFPARALALIWRGLKASAPVEVAAAEAAVLQAAEEPPAEPLDQLARLAAQGLRARQGRDFAAAAELCDQARDEGAELLCKCLDLGPIVRGATAKLADWITRTNDHNTASARLAYKDAVAVSEDAGPRFFEMLAAQLAHPWMVLRIISAVMHKPDEKYLAECEMAGFAERLMDEIDGQLKAVIHLDVEGGPAAGRAAGRTVDLLTQEIHELEDTIELSREGVWGGRVAHQKKALAGAVEERMRAAEKAGVAALPTQKARLAKLFKSVPLLEAEPDPRLLGRAITLLTFVDEIRSSASHGGFASTRAKLLEKLGENVDHYVEEVLDRLRTDEVENRDIAFQYLGAAAAMMRLIRDDKAAEIIRRRAHAVSGDPASSDAG